MPASASLCAAHATAARRYLGGDSRSWSIPITAGQSRVETGITLQSDITLNFPTWTDFEQNCGLSRLWAGLHFYASVPANQDMGQKIWDLVFEYSDDLIAGKYNIAAIAISILDPANALRLEGIILSMIVGRKI